MIFTKFVCVLLLAITIAEFGEARNINNAGLNLIKEFEGFRANFYGDPVGIRTIGYGHACHANDCSSIHPPITQAQGEALLKQDLVSRQTCVQNQVSFVNDNQFAALVSFVFNLGCGAFQGSTLLTKVKAKDYNGAAGEFGKWVHAGGKVLPGLVRRREAEKKLFLSGGGGDPPPSGCTCCKGNALGEFCGHELCGNCEPQHIYGCNSKGASPSTHYGNCVKGCTGSNNSKAHCNK